LAILAVLLSAATDGCMQTALSEQLIADPVWSRQISERIPIGLDALISA
jgi:hypothetical protein